MQKTAKRLSLGDQILRAMDGRRNTWLVEKTGLHPTTVSLIIRGRLIPTEEQLNRIELALNVSFKYD